MKKFNDLYAKLVHQISESFEDYDDAKFMADVRAGEYNRKKERAAKLLASCPMKSSTFRCRKCKNEYEVSMPDLSGLKFDSEKREAWDKFINSLSVEERVKIEQRLCDDCCGGAAASYQKRRDEENFLSRYNDDRR